MGQDGDIGIGNIARGPGQTAVLNRDGVGNAQAAQIGRGGVAVDDKATLGESRGGTQFDNAFRHRQGAVPLGVSFIRAGQHK